MSRDKVDLDRRRFLVNATGVVGGIGLGFAAIPFVGSWLPSSRAQSLGAPVEVDLTKVAVGQRITVAWRGQPVFIVHRSKEILENIDVNVDNLRDPNSLQSSQPSYAAGATRSIKPEYLIVTGLCTHLGCVPMYKPEQGSVDAHWKGGFFCPCHGSKFDFAGRVFKGVPAPTNLTIPPHKFLREDLILIGED